MKRCRTASLPGLTRQSILFRKKMDSRVISAFTRVFDALLPAHDETNMLRRRSFLVLIARAAAWPLAARAQQGERMRRIGVLQGPSESDPEWSRRFGAFKQRLQELGWTEGRNVAFEFRFAGGKPERLPALAAELVHSAVDVILTNAAQPIEAARKATSTIPIVMASVGDALGAGYVASLRQCHWTDARRNRPEREAAAARQRNRPRTSFGWQCCGTATPPAIACSCRKWSGQRRRSALCCSRSPSE